MNPLLAIGLLVGAYYFFDKSKQRSFNSGVRVQIANVELDSGKLLVTFNIQNPNSQAVTIRSLFGEVAVNGQKVGLVKNAAPMVIQPNAESRMKLQVSFKVPNLITTLASLTKGIAGSKILFTGTVNANNVATPLNIEYQLS